MARMLRNINIEYYNQNANDFYASTIDADMSLWRDEFERLLPDGGRILDAGCGSGRDSKAFIQHGFSVVSIDASKEMCKLASELTGQEVWTMRFDEMNFEDEFDGIWACASLLHVSSEELPFILQKMRRALDKGGVMYASFKLGNGLLTKGERTFLSFNEDELISVFEKEGFTLIKSGITQDVRPERIAEGWVNIIVK